MRSLTLAILLSAATATAASAGTVVGFQDDFDSFALGTDWQATSWQGAVGVPDVTLAGGVNHNGPITLQMGSSQDDGEFRGIETIDSIPVSNVLSLTLDVRTTAANAHMPIEAALVGSSGEWVNMFYTYTAWTSNVTDSAGDSASWGQWYGGTQPQYYRRWVMTLDDIGLLAQVFDEPGTLRWSQTFTGLTLGDLGGTAKIVLRQQEGGVSPGTAAPTVWVDYVALTGLVPEPSTFALAAFGLLGLAFWGRRRRR